MYVVSFGRLLRVLPRTGGGGEGLRTISDTRSGVILLTRSRVRLVGSAGVEAFVDSSRTISARRPDDPETARAEWIVGAVCDGGCC